MAMLFTLMYICDQIDKYGYYDPHHRVHRD